MITATVEDDATFAVRPLSHYSRLVTGATPDRIRPELVHRTRTPRADGVRSLKARMRKVITMDSSGHDKYARKEGFGRCLMRERSLNAPRTAT